MKLRQKPISCGPGGKRRILGLFSLIEGFEWAIIKLFSGAFNAVKGGWASRWVYLKAACERISWAARVKNIGDFLEEHDVQQGRW
ncbi:MAG: hypothetical protein JSW23_03825 [Planctomycetota bacterium]|nr:MAG: hypothetical protein JSW23_03825 [Planctomycetota bacterium]